MQNLLEGDPHKAYLDAVFARVERIRTIDPSVLTTRYGVDPAALSPVDGDSPVGDVAARVLKDADAQREELREHLDGLTREFVASGLDYDAAACEARKALGEPKALGRLIARVAARSALGVSDNTVGWLRLVPFDRYICALLSAAVFAGAEILRADLNQAALICVLVTTILGVVSGCMLGECVTPELRGIVKSSAEGLREILALPTLRRLTWRQKAERHHIARVCARLSEIAKRSSGESRRFPLWVAVIASVPIAALCAIPPVGLLWIVKSVLHADVLLIVPLVCGYWFRAVSDIASGVGVQTRLARTVHLAS